MRVNIANRICRQCGKTFLGGYHAWYCPECREERKRETDARFRAKHGADRPLGSIDHCDVCGGEYIVANWSQKYCPSCAPDAIRETARIAALRRLREHKVPARNARQGA